MGQREITPYGLNQRYSQASWISDRILGGSDKWNERLRIYANYASANADGKGSTMGFGRLKRGLNEIWPKIFRHCVCRLAVGANLAPEFKVARTRGNGRSPYYAYTIENLRERRYPLFDEIYAYCDGANAASLDPKVGSTCASSSVATDRKP